MLMRNADLAMYQAKRAGRDTFRVFQKELSDSLSRRLEIERNSGAPSRTGNSAWSISR